MFKPSSKRPKPMSTEIPFLIEQEPSDITEIARVKTNRGVDLTVYHFSDDRTMFSLDIASLGATIHLTKQEALELAKALKGKNQ